MRKDCHVGVCASTSILSCTLGKLRLTFLVHALMRWFIKMLSNVTSWTCRPRPDAPKCILRKGGGGLHADTALEAQLGGCRQAASQPPGHHRRPRHHDKRVQQLSLPSRRRHSTGTSQNENNPSRYVSYL